MAIYVRRIGKHHPMDCVQHGEPIVMHASPITDEERYYYDHPELILNWRGEKVGPRQRRLLRIYERQNGQCCYCGEHMELWWTFKPGEATKKQCSRFATFEHVKPKSRNGRSTLANLRAACHFCNSQRADKPLDEFLAEIATKGRKGLQRELHLAIQTGGSRTFIKTRLTASYTVFWMNCLFYPDILFIILNILPGPNRFSSLLHRPLKELDDSQIRAYCIEYNRRSQAEDYDPETRETRKSNEVTE